MTPKIKFSNIWADDHITELEIVASTESSSFSTKVYVSYPTLEKITEELDAFRTQIHGGLYDLKFGEFGPEYESGAIKLRFYFQKNGKLNLTVNMQTQFYSFGIKRIADEATMHLRTEQFFLDEFVFAIKSISKNVGNESELICIS